MALTSLVRVAARALTGYTYITLGYASFTEPGGRVQAAAPTLAKIRSVVPLPDDDEMLVKASGLTQATAGALLAAGIKPRLMALTIFGTLVPTTIAGHGYWRMDEGAERGSQQVQFRKNMAMLGGLLFCAIDKKRRKRG